MEKLRVHLLFELRTYACFLRLCSEAGQLKSGTTSARLRAGAAVRCHRGSAPAWAGTQNLSVRVQDEGLPEPQGSGIARLPSGT